MKDEVLISFFAQIIAKETVTQELLIDMYSSGDDDMKADLHKQTKQRYQELLTVYLKELYILAKS